MTLDRPNNGESQNNPEQSKGFSGEEENKIWNWLKKIVAQYFKENEEKSNEFLQELNQFKRDIEKKLDSLKEDNESLRNDVAGLNHQFTQLLSSVTKQGRDPASYTNPTSDVPQHYVLSPKFTQSRNNDFTWISEKLFDAHPNRSSIQDKHPWLEISKIHSTLAEEILIKGIKLFESDSPLVVQKSPEEQIYRQSHSRVSASQSLLTSRF